MAQTEPAQPAQPAQPAAPPEARDAFQEGTAHMMQADFAAALEAFQRSYDIFPSARTLFNVASCQERLGNTAAALEAYKRLLGAEGESLEPEMRQTVEEKVRALEAPAGS